MVYTPNAILDKLIAAGLGDVEQTLIEPEQFEAAMRGETVTLTRQQKRRIANIESGHLTPRRSSFRSLSASDFCNP